MALIRCPDCNELTVRGQPVEWSPLWEFECRNGHVWRADPDDPICGWCGHRIPEAAIPVGDKRLCLDCWALIEQAKSLFRDAHPDGQADG